MAYHVARPMARGVQEVMRTPRRQRAHDVVVKSVGRAGDSRARGRRGLDGREVGAVPIGRWHSPWVDGRRPTGADEAPIAGSRFRFCPIFCQYPKWKPPVGSLDCM